MTLELFSATSHSDETPGPGAYESYPHYTVGNKYTRHSRISQRFPEKPAETSNVDFMGTKVRRYAQSRQSPRYVEREIDVTPGPEYRPDPMENYRRGVHIRPKTAFGRSDITPGPGPAAYSPSEWPKTRVPSQGKRAPIYLSDVPDSPGPGKYNTRTTIGRDSPRLSIRPKTEPRQKPEKRPGYEHNTISQLGNDTPRWSFPKAPPPPDDPNQNPGPGAYEPITQNKRKIMPGIGNKYKQRAADVSNVQYIAAPVEKRTIAYTISPRTPSGLWKTEETVGPSYIPPSSLTLKGKTIGEKRSIPPATVTPGPGEYNAYLQKREMPSFTLKGPEERCDWMPRDLSTPGPGAYNITTENTMPKYTIGHRSRKRRSKSQR